MSLAFTNARLVLPATEITGSLAIEDGTIAAIDSGASAIGEDLEGDYLIPGLVELHTDHLENHYRPRPGVTWHAMAALQAHDAQIAGSGITTVFDAVRIGTAPDLPDLAADLEQLIGAIATAREDGRLRAEHFVHLRCELPSHDVVAHFETYADNALTRLASLMDHTPGQRQFTSLAAYRRFYSRGRSETELDAYIAARLDEHERHSVVNRRALLSTARALSLPLASHDDATLAHVEEAVSDGIDISEFPTTLEAATAAHAAGLAVLMGAPNVVRGGSHSGNISALDLIAGGVLDVLSSDYVPFSPIQAAFSLPQRIAGMSLAKALATVTRNPAEAAGLDDRGMIAIGKRADLVRVSVIDGMPVVRAVWREGRRVA